MSISVDGKVLALIWMLAWPAFCFLCIAANVKTWTDDTSRGFWVILAVPWVVGACMFWPR